MRAKISILPKYVVVHLRDKVRHLELQSDNLVRKRKDFLPIHHMHEVFTYIDIDSNERFDFNYPINSNWKYSYGSNPKFHFPINPYKCRQCHMSYVNGKVTNLSKISMDAPDKSKITPFCSFFEPDYIINSIKYYHFANRKIDESLNWSYNKEYDKREFTLTKEQMIKFSLINGKQVLKNINKFDIEYDVLSYIYGHYDL
jgi:hypothetical protein